MNKDSLNKLRETLRKLFAMLGSPNEHEKNIARQKIDELAAKHKLSWNDVLELVGISGDGGKDDTARLFEELLRGRGKQADILINLAGAADKFRTADGRVWGTSISMGTAKPGPCAVRGSSTGCATVSGRTRKQRRLRRRLRLACAI